MRQRRATTRWVLALGLATGWACESARSPGGFQPDLIPPTITLKATADTQQIASGLSFTVNAADNLALNDVRLTFSGGFIDTTDTIFRNQTLASVTLPISLTPAQLIGSGGAIKIVGRATDGRGNVAQDSITIFLVNIQALKVYLLQPAPGSVASTGKSIVVDVAAAQLSGIKEIGFLIVPPTAATNPTTPPNDSIIYTPPYLDSLEYVDTLTVAQATGTFQIEGFAVDSGGRRSTTNIVTITVQSAANDTTPPQVSESLGTRVEVSDTVLINATDPSGISWIGFRVRLASDSAVVLFDTIPAGGGAFTDVVRRFTLGLGSIITTYPTGVLVDGYACDGAARRNCGFSSTNGFTVPPPPADSVLVVAGISRSFPVGGSISDAIYDRNRRELYLTNTPLSRVEIFQVANTTFVANGLSTSNGSSVAGALPYGIALWPHDTVGDFGDTVIVANSGGTELSVLNTASRRLAWRQDLPNYLIEHYQTINVGGIYEAEITVYDLSDRPQYVGTVCRVGAAAPACDPDSIFAVYSTTPTASSTTPFNGAGTIRIEKLINPNALVMPADTGRLYGHLFYEIGDVNASQTSETLRVELIRPGSFYGDMDDVTLSACAGVTINFATFGLGDTTFARNSGNFTHAFLGEGGNALDANRRVMAYTTKNTANDPFVHGAPTFRSCQTSPLSANVVIDAGRNDFDGGMSPAVEVSDFISNTGIRVAAIATNFNGLTNVVRADSLYYLDEGLRLKGASPVSVGTPGMDMNYFHAFAAGQGGTPGTGSGVQDSTNRVIFVADPSGNILVFDTFFYNQIGSIPVRDPIIGPLRVAKDSVAGQPASQLLFAVTTRGLVMVKLPTFPNPNPAPRLQRIRTARNR